MQSLLDVAVLLRSEELKIEKSATITDVPIVAIRDFLRRYRDSAWYGTFVRDVLNLSHESATELVHELQSDGYIEPLTSTPLYTVIRGEPDNEIDDRRGDLDGVWMTTIKGNALGNVSFAPRVKQLTAERALRNFLDRVDLVNIDDRWMMEVMRVILFGSYLDPDVNKLGDVDLAIILQWKESDADIREQQRRKYIRREEAQGRTFRTFFEELAAPEIDIRRYLKGRSRTLTFHLAEDPILDSTRAEVIYAGGERHGIASHL